MQKRILSLRVLLAVMLLVSMMATAVAYAQEATTETPVAEAAAVEGEAVAEGEVVAEGEAVAEASTNPLVPLGINTGFLIAQILNFLLVFGLLSLAVWRPLMNMLDNRALTIQKGLEDAAQAATARRNAEVEAEKVLASARTDAAKVVEEGRGRGEEVARGIEVEARTEAEGIRAEARVRSEEERNRQLADLRGQVISIAVAMSQRIIGETLDAQRQQALVNDFFAKVPQGARELTGSIEVVSALPLSEDEQNRVRSEIGAQDVTFNVDPAILGGLVLRSNDHVVDGSVRNNLSDLAGRLR